MELTLAAIQRFASPVTSFAADVVRTGDRGRVLENVRQRFPKGFFGRYKPLMLTIVFVILILAAVAVLAPSVFRQYNPISEPSTYKSIEVGKSFAFPIRSGGGEAVQGELKMTATTVEKTNNILIKGKPAKARDGKLFLIINLELDNPTQNKLGLSPVELIRLIDPSGRRFAPDVHNDKVSIEAISIKKTRVGFVVDERVTGWKLQVGEVGGNKEVLDLPI